MGVCATVLKRCPFCNGLGSMQIRTGTCDTYDLNNLDKLSDQLDEQGLRWLKNAILTDGDPFICPNEHVFRLNGEKERKTYGSSKRTIWR